MAAGCDLRIVIAELDPAIRLDIYWGYNYLKVSFDPAKRDLTLRHRGLDFARADQVFEGRTATIVDDRFDYGETRFITAGEFDGRLVVIVWTQRGETRHIISMRHCRAKEEEIWHRRMD